LELAASYDGQADEIQAMIRQKDRLSDPSSQAPALIWHFSIRWLVGHDPCALTRATMSDSPAKFAIRLASSCARIFACRTGFSSSRA
jgi:hypothetical protein